MRIEAHVKLEIHKSSINPEVNSKYNIDIITYRIYILPFFWQTLPILRVILVLGSEILRLFEIFCYMYKNNVYTLKFRPMQTLILNTIRYVLILLTTDKY